MKLNQVDSILNCKSILLVSWHGIGDNVMLVPTILKLKKLNPSLQIYFAGLHRFGSTLNDLYEGLPLNSAHAILQDAWNDFNDYEKGLVVIENTAKKFTEDYGIEAYVMMHTPHGVGYRNHKIFRFADTIGLQFDSFEELVPKLFASKKTTSKYVLLHLTSGGVIKQLTRNDWLTIDKYLQEKYKAGHGSDFEFPQIDGRAYKYSFNLRLPEMETTKDLIASATEVVCIDSGIMHVAGALQVPLKALFTRTPVEQAFPFYNNKAELFDIYTDENRLAMWPKYLEEIKERYK